MQNQVGGFTEYLRDDYKGHLPTCGFGISQSVDHKSFLKRMTTHGFKILHFTFHGLREHHDWFVGRDGAFDDIVVATRRARESGYQTTWQLFVDRKGLEDVYPFVEMAINETGKQPSIGIPYHRVSQRLWRFEKIRPTLEDALKHKLDTVIDEPKKNGFSKPETLTASAWLEKWKQATSMDGFWCHFEPEEWPPRELYEWMSIQIKRNRTVYLDPLCAPPIRLGELTDGKVAITERLRKIQAPKYVDIKPEDVVLTSEEKNRLHPTGFSVRALAISKKCHSVAADE